jgi:transcriptional regulator with PAS, ATPase and Fis domain
MQQVTKLIDRIALADVPVYIFGASGTGKELAAKAIHAGSERAKHPFVPINCGALPPKLLASELFGHRKGAFTGAIGNRPGLFKLADKGTLFLDEVADMDKEMQTHLLRVLQDGTFRSLGDTEEISVDVRIISASNRDLEKVVTVGRFREDLFYRLNVVRVDLPSLTERREDIPLLVEFLAKRHFKSEVAPRFTREVMNLLMAAEWPGNVRELENEVLRATTMAGDKGVIELEDLSPRFSEEGGADAWSGQGSLKDRVTHFEGVLITQTLAACGGNATKAAKTLGVSRATLYKKMEKCGISPSS